MKMLSTAKLFADNSKELFTAFRDYANHVQSLEGDKTTTFPEKSLDVKEKVINK